MIDLNDIKVKQRSPAFRSFLEKDLVSVVGLNNLPLIGKNYIVAKFTVYDDEDKAPPFTSTALIKEITDKLTGVDFSTAKFLVIYTVEWANYLHAIHGVPAENITVVADEPRAEFCQFAGYSVIPAKEFLADEFNQDENMKFDVVVGNPPYQNPNGVKRGVGIYKKFMSKIFSLSSDNYGIVVPNSFMYQDPHDSQNKKLLTELLNSGVRQIKHNPPETFDANTLTVSIVGQKYHDGDVEFLTYDVDKKSNDVHSVFVPREDLSSIAVWPCARSMNDFLVAKEMLSHVSKKYPFIHSDARKQSQFCVEYEYLIGMEKERLNRQNPIRGVNAVDRNNTKVRGENLSCFINVSTWDEAVDLVSYIDGVGQEWARTIPRGSSFERWMMGPIVNSWKSKKSDP